MAITIAQQPNRFNLASQYNVWTLSGLTTEDGYLFVVRDADNNPISTVRQPANPAGVAHFNVSRILQSLLSSSFYETTLRLADTPGAAAAYSIAYGTYTGAEQTIEGAMPQQYVYNGYNSWRILNWNDAPYNPVPQAVLCDTGETNVAYAEPFSFLTNWPEASYEVRSNTWHTLGFLNRIKPFDDGTPWVLNEQPAYVRIRFYDAVDSLIQTVIYSITAQNGLGPRADYDSATIGQYTNDNLVGVVGVGPQNLKEANFWPTSVGLNWNQITQTWGNYSVLWNASTAAATVARYEVDIMSIDYCYVVDNGLPSSDNASELENYLGDVIYNYKFNIGDTCTRFEPITVSFLNQFGVKDYFTFDRRNTKRVTTEREDYYKTNPAWSGATFAIDQHTGGRTTFSSQIESIMTLSTNWMNDDVSKWLEELYTSPSVQIYYDGEWEPVTIIGNNYEEKTYARNSLFQHILEVKFANNKIVQRG